MKDSVVIGIAGPLVAIVATDQTGQGVEQGVELDGLGQDAKDPQGQRLLEDVAAGRGV